MTATEILGLVIAAMAGGAVNAVAGGGTLVTFPALLLFGTPPVVANATSTLALVVGTSGGIYGYREHLGPVRLWLWRFMPVSVLGGLIGAVLLTCTSNQTFSKLVPFLILFATLLFLAQGAFRRFARIEAQAGPDGKHRGVWGAVLFQLAVAVYGGYFGAGIGILMLVVLGFLGLTDIHAMNGLKNFFGITINLVAAAWFIWNGAVQWPIALVMVAGATVGGYAGARFARRIGKEKARAAVVVIGLGVTAILLLQRA